MKPEDLVLNKWYLVFHEMMQYAGQESHRDHYVFLPAEGSNRANWLLKSFDLLYVVEVEGKPTPHPNIYTGEKTMPAPRKPEQIRIELTNEETIQALTLFGYNLEGYEFGRGHNLSIFTLNLKKGVDEKTKATD